MKEIRDQVMRMAIHNTFDFEYEFVECDVCRTKLGSPILCSGCLSNRATIEFLKNVLDNK